MINLTQEEFLNVNTRPAENIKLACEGSGAAVVIEDGVITDIVKEKK